jgi:CubicO group peptidase (beta-lactamase class C family)
MHKWLPPALDYIPRWLDFQMRMTRQPGCVIAVMHRDKLVLEQAFGFADLARQIAMTPRHRFRVASHSKSFTAAAVMKLREAGKLGLDDPAGRFVKGLHRDVARATVGLLLSHGAGLPRDGRDAGQFFDRRPYLDRSELLADLALAPPIAASSRFKYSNHGYGLLGLIIEAVTGEDYATWMRREILDPIGLAETDPDMRKRTRLALGHTGELPLGRRAGVPGTAAGRAMAPAAGFVATARDLARFFAQLGPGAARSVLSASSRREMVRRHWRNPDAAIEGYYGYGLASGTLGGWDWFGHSGSLQGFITRTCVLPAQEITISILTNAVDGWAPIWVDGTIHILRGFAQHGPPLRRTRDWDGRWWTLWGALDLVPMRDVVMVTAPALINPMADASEITVAGRDKGRISRASGYASHGEPVRRVRGPSGKVTELWLGAAQLVPERRLAREIETRYERGRKAKRRTA